MFLDSYFHRQGDVIEIDARQGSDFAKRVAGDFNPIHNADNRRFCVPGDLMFALALSRYGVHRDMVFAFTGMVGANTPLRFPARVEDTGTIVNGHDKPVVEMQLSGESRDDENFVAAVVRQYVAFSGHNFPDILVPLLAEQGVMINPERPLVMYESMTLHFDTLDFESPSLALSNAVLDVDGKRGDVRLEFTVTSGDTPVGRGYKKLVIGGLKPYDEAAMAAVVAQYEANKRAYCQG